MLYETLGGAFSITKDAQVSDLYKFSAACISVFQGPFNDFAAFREKQYLIANCKCQIGQLTNVLNYLYDSIQNRIYITQSTANPEFFWKFAYPPAMFLGRFADAPKRFLRRFGDKSSASLVTVVVPAGLPNLSDLTATVAQIFLTGIPYQIIQV